MPGPVLTSAEPGFASRFRWLRFAISDGSETSKYSKTKFNIESIFGTISIIWIYLIFYRDIIIEKKLIEDMPCLKIAFA